MAQDETDTPAIKQLKWDFHTLERMARDYPDTIDFANLQAELLQMVTFLKGNPGLTLG